jgi:spermidine synthase
MRALPAGSRRIGLVGLGTGTLAAYGRAGDQLRIYEINPEARHLATSWFTYISNCAAKVEIVMGDARLSMERELPQHFDLLALDAFSGDAIPVHLLTKEAFEIYQRHLKRDGILAVHISNHYLDLEPVVVNLAKQFQYQIAAIDHDEGEEDVWDYSSTWILLSHNEKIINSPAISAATYTVKTNSTRVPLWTDDFTSVFQILK